MRIMPVAGQRWSPSGGFSRYKVRASRHGAGQKATKCWPLWGQITLAIGGAMLLISVLAGESVRTLETQYLLAGLQTQSQRAFALLSAATLDAVIAEDRPVLETIVTQAVHQDPDIVSVTLENEAGRARGPWQNPAPAPPR